MTNLRLFRFGVLLVVVALMLAATGPRGQAQVPRPMALDDLLAASRWTAPTPSPHGRLVAYVRTTTDLRTGRRNGDIYVVPSDGSAAPKLFAGGTASESTPQFSPDSRQIAFISARDGGPQQ